MKNWSRPTAISIAVTLVAGCYGSRTSQKICDCRFDSIEAGGEYSRIQTAPSHFDEDGYWEDWLVDIPDIENIDAFRNRTTHWYQNAEAESFAYIVIEGSDRMNAYIVLSADKSRSEPLDARMLGTPFGAERKFWEKCQK